MTLRGLVLLFAFISIPAAAQNDPAIEIHGVVTEVGLNLGLAGAEVTLFEFVGPDRVRTSFATSATDTGGEFHFHPKRFGDYWVEVKKQSYFATIPVNGQTPSAPLSESTGTLVSVGPGHPSLEVRFALMRPGELTGSVIDENDKPPARMVIQVTTAGSPFLSKATAVTNPDGSFTVNNLIPGEYLVEVSPGSLGSVTVMPTFTEDDLRAVDQTIEAVYWPGVPDERSAAPVRVSPGVSTTLGTIRMRKTESYRARVSMTGCQPEDLPRFGVETSGGTVFVLNSDGKLQSFNGLTVTSCQDFLTKGLKPGSYTFRLSSQKTWAMASVEVTNKNLEAALVMSPGMNVTGRVVGGDGVTLPSFDKLRVTLKGTGFFTPPSFASALNAKGEFGVRDLRETNHRVELSGLGDKYYVKEIRVDGRAADGVVTLHEGSKLEIVIDDQPAAIAGSVIEGEKPFSQPLVFAAKWPSLEVTHRPATGDNDGNFQITGLEPGEYRILAVQSTSLPDGQQISPKMLTRLWDSAEKVTLERGGSQSVSLKLSDPLR